MIRIVLFSFLAVLFSGIATAEEKIHDFKVDIEVQTNGNILVTETISVTPEHRQINRGIYRALPRYYAIGDEKFWYEYKVLSVTRNGKKEPVAKQREGNGYILRIGDEDVILPYGEMQTYQIRYRVKNQIRYFENRDELYWNITGNYWDFPIDSVEARVKFPVGVEIKDIAAYTGKLGEAGADYTTNRFGNGISVQTSRRLRYHEGLSLSVSIAKGLIDPPSAADKRGILWQRYGGLMLLVLTGIGILLYYFRTWQRVGVDAPKLPVFARYHPPKRISPAAAHYVFFRDFQGNNAFAATLVDLAVKGMMTIKTDKKKVTLTKVSPSPSVGLSGQQRKLFNALLKSRDEKVIGGAYDSGFASAYKDFRASVARSYGEKYFKWNRGASILMIIASVIMVIIAAAFTVNWSVWHFAAILALIVINAAFLYLLPAQTRAGEELRSEIAGFRLYLETAEKLQMNAVDIHGEQPPPMSKDRYEALLPYAIALDVEKPWSKYFEDVLPDEARNYNPGWNSSGFYTASSLHSFNNSLTSSISSGVSTASVQPSSSSGSGGGGFSGGGGGGGGGGGW